MLATSVLLLTAYARGRATRRWMLRDVTANRRTTDGTTLVSAAIGGLRLAWNDLAVRGAARRATAYRGLNAIPVSWSRLAVIIPQ